MGKFHDLMDRDLQIRGYSLSTRKVYLARVRGFVRFFMSAPDLLAIEDIKRYLLDLTQVRRVSWSSFNQTVCALRFFYSVTLEKDWDIQRSNIGRIEGVNDTVEATNDLCFGHASIRLLEHIC